MTAAQDGDRVLAQRRRRDESQYWAFGTTRSSAFRLRPDSHLEHALDVINDDTDDTLRLASAGDFSGQFWSLQSAHDGHYVLRNQFTPDKLLADLRGEHGPRLVSRSPGHSHHWRLVRAQDRRLAARFGYGYMRVYDRPARGRRPLLMVVVTDPGLGGVHAKTCSDYKVDMFGPGSTPTVNQLFLKYSDDHFSWSFVGCESLVLPPNPAGGSWGSVDRAARVVRKLIATGFDFARLDRNGDRRVTTDELTLLVVINTEHDGGSTRTPSGGCLRYGAPVEICLGNGVTAVGPGFVKSVVAHELAHTLGAKHNYSPWDGQQFANAGLSVMSHGGLYMDAWNRMALGWTRPRVRALRRSNGGSIIAGSATLTRADLEGDDRPVLLYDPSRGVSEYFLLEYRSDSVWDSGIPGRGLVVWQIRQRSGADHTLVKRADCKGRANSACVWAYGCSGGRYGPFNDGDTLCEASGDVKEEDKRTEFECCPVSVPAAVPPSGFLGSGAVWGGGDESSLRWIDAGAILESYTGASLEVTHVATDELRVVWRD